MAQSAVQNETNGFPANSSTTPDAPILATPTDIGHSGVSGGTSSPRNSENQHVHSASSQTSSNQDLQTDGVGGSSPPAKKSKSDHTSQTQISDLLSCWTQLSLELKLTVFEFLEGDTLMALWRASHEFSHVFYESLGLKLWSEVRRAFGLEPTGTSQFPTHDELRILLYILNDSCQVCRSRGAPHQWSLGTQLCSRCLISRLVTRRDFVQEHGYLFDGKRAAFEEIGWCNPVDMPGLEFVPMATNFLDVRPEQRGHFVACRRLANSAAIWAQQLQQEHPGESEAWVDGKVKALISKAQGARKVRIHYAQRLSEQGSIDVDSIRTQRKRRIMIGLTQVQHLKLQESDVPRASDPEWRLLAYRGTELTAREWHSIKISVTGVVKRHRTARLFAMLENHQPPTPASVHVPQYRNIENMANEKIGILPISVFLKVCANMDLHTIAAMERLSRRTRDVLRSQAADPTWRSIKSSLGLNVCFDRWPERAFLAFALRQRCSYCHQEGLNIPPISLVLCGDCFESNVIVMGNGSEDLSKSIVKSMSSIQSGPFVRSGWVDTPNKNTKLYQRTYVDALTHWMQNLPAAVKTCVPNGLIAKHIENYTDSFVKVAKICETWQKDRDPNNVRLMERRAQAIVNKAGEHQHVLGVPGHVFESEEWKEVAKKAYPLSRKEWSVIEEFILEMFRKHQVLGGGGDG